MGSEIAGGAEADQGGYFQHLKETDYPAMAALVAGEMDQLLIKHVKEICQLANERDALRITIATIRAVLAEP